MKKLFWASFSFMFLFTLLAVADSAIVIPEGDPLAALLNLIMNWGSIAPLAKASAILVILVQGFKKLVPGFQYLRFVVTIGGVLYGVIQSMIGGLSWDQALVFAMLTSGGAVAIYELFKNPLNSAFLVKKD